MTDLVITVNITSQSTTDQINKVINCMEAVGVLAITCFCQADDNVYAKYNDGNALFHIIPKTSMMVERGWLTRPVAKQMWEWYNIYDSIRQCASIRIANETDQDSVLAADKMHFLVDSSAIPGTKTWMQTGNSPYHPFIDDVRVPGNPCLKITEVPQTTTYIGSTRQHLDLFINPNLFQPAFDLICDKIPTMVFSVWCEEENNNIDNLESNLKHITKTCSNIDFKMINEIAK